MSAPAAALPGTYEQLPCGCEIWSEGDGTPEGSAFMMRACSLSCPYVRFAVETSKELDHPVDYVRERS
jgi:hypothetical protein